MPASAAGTTSNTPAEGEERDARGPREDNRGPLSTQEHNANCPRRRALDPAVGPRGHYDPRLRGGGSTGRVKRPPAMTVPRSGDRAGGRGPRAPRAATASATGQRDARPADEPGAQPGPRPNAHGDRAGGARRASYRDRP